MNEHTICLDIGTYSIKIYHAKSQRFIKEANCYITRQHNPVIYGNEAEVMEDRLPDFMQFHRPMLRGLITHFKDMMATLEFLLKKHGLYARRAQYLIAVPTDVTEVEKRAFSDLLYFSHMKASQVTLVERGIAEGIGCGIDLWKHQGSCILNLGSNAEVTVLSGNGITINRLIPIGVEEYLQAIKQEVHNTYGLLIGCKTATKLLQLVHQNTEDTAKTEDTVKTEETEDNTNYTVNGRSYITGYPDQCDVSNVLLIQSITPLLEELCQTIELTIARASTDVVHMIRQNGICLTGGYASIEFIRDYLIEKLEYPIQVIPEADQAVIQGLKLILEQERYHSMTYSMLDEDYRWLR